MTYSHSDECVLAVVHFRDQGIREKADLTSMAASFDSILISPVVLSAGTISREYENYAYNAISQCIYMTKLAILRSSY